MELLALLVLNDSSLASILLLQIEAIYLRACQPEQIDAMTSCVLG